MPSGLIIDIEIEGGGRRQTLDNVYGMSGSAWKENAITSSSKVVEAKPAEEKQFDVEEFAALVEERMESREEENEGNAPGY